MTVKQTTAAALATALLSVSPAQAGDFVDDRIAQNRRLIERYFEEVWNQGRLEVLDDLMHPVYRNHSPGLPDPQPGPAGLKPIVAAMRIGLPDMHYTIEDMVIAPDKVAVRVILRATHKGELFGMAPTGRRIEVEQMQIERIEAGKIIEHWRRTDDLGLLRQLGQLP